MAVIVVADDEFLLADMMVSVLGDAGHTARAAPHGLAALKLIRSLRPELVITDFMMPLMTGLELAQAMKDDPELADIPIILVSGAPGITGRGHPDGFDAVLDKPCNVVALIDLVRRLLEP